MTTLDKWLLGHLFALFLGTIVARFYYKRKAKKTAEAMTRRWLLDTYCKMTCVQGSERGKCPCVDPEDCAMKKSKRIEVEFYLT